MALIDFLLTQTCTVKPWLRVAAGADVYGEPEQRRCRIQGGHYLTTTGESPVDQVIARAKMYCTGEKIPTRSIIECGGERYIVIDCYAPRSLKAADHLEILLL